MFRRGFRDRANSIYSRVMNARKLSLESIGPLLLLVMVACGGGVVPQEALSAAEADTKGAEVGGAAENPKAALHLKLAKEEIQKAKDLINDGDNEAAARTIDRAQVDAQLALALAREGKARAEADEAKEQISRLQKLTK
jgi:Domain of unknown function (DUF4398)